MSFVNPNIKKARTIPSEYYYSNEKFEELKESVFCKSWQFICDTTQIKLEGDCFPYNFIKEYIDEPLLLVNNTPNRSLLFFEGLFIDSPLKITIYLIFLLTLL